MTKQIKLKASVRDVKENTNDLRKQGFIPAVIYGNGINPNGLKIKTVEMEKAYKEAGEGTLIDLEIDNKAAVKVLVKDVQRNIVKNNLSHIDFYQVNMDKEITAEIHFNFIGVSKAEKELGGVLVKNLHSIEIECLPKDLVNHIDVDLSQLATMDSHIKISDLMLPAGVKVLADLDTIIVGIVAVAKEVEEVKPEATAEVPAANNAKAPAAGKEEGKK